MNPSIARILDANANRAREGLRVLEEYARFVLEDGLLAERTKRLRHEVASVPIPGRSRNIASDVGCGLEGASEYTRDDAASVAVAAARRTGEALRSLEEYGKVEAESLGRRFERLRYELYSLERDICVRMDARSRFGDVRIYAIVTESICRRPWLDVARLAIEGGADCLQLREKHLSDVELATRARQLSDMCHEAGVLFIMNDRADIANLVQADGIHVGQDDISVDDVRRLVDTGMIVGLSTHSIEQVDNAIAASPDYIAVGPMFDTQTKRQSILPGPKLSHYAVHATSLPVVPIGGIDAVNLPQISSTGARCICVCSAIIAKEDPAEAVRILKDRIIAET